jgi:integrase
MPTDPYVEGTENTEEPVERKGFAREWGQFLVAFLIQVDELLTAEGVVTDNASKEKLADLLAKRLQDAMAAHGRICGDYSPDPLPNTFPVWEGRRVPLQAVTKTSADRPVVSLDGICDGWKSVSVVKPRTVDETVYAVRDLKEFLGHNDAARITRDDLTRWRQSMKDARRSNNTWNNRLSLVRQVFAHGISEGVLTTDPTTGLRLRKARQKSPPPYSDADASRILLAARKETRPSLRWAHWVMAFSGMRAGEVLQLLGRDVRQDGGVWLIDVNEDDPTKSVKTSERRHVPVHPALIREGFVAYAQKIAADAPLFPDKGLDRHGKRGGRAWNLIGKWARLKAGIKDPDEAPDHSWRHRIEDELRAAEAPEDVRDAITGHSRRTTGRQYGVRGEALTRLHRHLSRIPVPVGLFREESKEAA